MICFATTEWIVQVRYSLNLDKWARASDLDFQLQKQGQKCYAFRALNCEFIYFHVDFFKVNLILFLFFYQKFLRNFKWLKTEEEYKNVCLYVRLLFSSRTSIEWLYMCIFKSLALNFAIILRPHPLKSYTIKAYMHDA